MALRPRYGTGGARVKIISMKETLERWKRSSANASSSYYSPPPIRPPSRSPLQPVSTSASHDEPSSCILLEDPPSLTPIAEKAPHKLPSPELLIGSSHSPPPSHSTSDTTMHDEAPSADSRSAREDRQLNTAPSPTPSSPEVSPSVDDPSVKSGTLSGLSDVARGKQKATEEEVQMWNVEEETAKKTDRRTAERKGHRWFPFESLAETNGKVIGNIKVRQRPQPVEEKEKEERELEWSTPKPGYSDSEVNGVYQKLCIINKYRLQEHHHFFPSFKVFKLHYPRLPKWAREGKPPKWRSPVDEELLAGIKNKLYRYFYAWCYELYLEEADRFLEEMEKEEWIVKAEEYKVGSSFKKLIGGMKHLVSLARERGDDKLNSLWYIGMGARSNEQLNDTCRSFDHLHGSKSLFGLALEIIRSYHDANPSSKNEVVQTFLSHLPLELFPYSYHIFMFAESIFAVSLRSAPVFGGTNVISCGDINIPAAFRAHVQRCIEKFGDKSQLVRYTIMTMTPVSLSCILYDRARRHGWDTLAQLEIGITLPITVDNLGVGKAEDSVSSYARQEDRDAAMERNERIRVQERELRAKEKEFETPPLPADRLPKPPPPAPPAHRQSLTPSHSAPPPHSSSSSNVPAASTTVPLPQSSKPARRGPREASTKSSHVSRIMNERGILNLSSSQLHDLVRTLPYPSDNTNDLVNSLQQLSIDMQRLVVGHLLFRKTNSGRSGGGRQFDNFLTLADLSSSHGVRLRTNVKPTGEKIVSTANFVGVGLDPKNSDVLNFNVTVRINSSKTQMVVVLKWFAEVGKLLVFEADGTTPVQVNAPSRGPKLVVEYRDVGWEREKLETLGDLEDLGRILGVRD